LNIGTKFAPAKSETNPITSLKQKKAGETTFKDIPLSIMHSLDPKDGWCLKSVGKTADNMPIFVTEVAECSIQVISNQ